MVEDEFNKLRTESENNVKSLEWLKPFWDPLYTCTPTETCEPVKRLISALRDIYNKSQDYNRSECMTSFLVKTTNQLVIVCRSYLDNNGSSKVLTQDPSSIIQKITVSNYSLYIIKLKNLYSTLKIYPFATHSAHSVCSTFLFVNLYHDHRSFFEILHHTGGTEELI